MEKYEKERIQFEQYKDFPYCVVGHSSIPESFSITLTGKGMKEIVKKISEEDLLHITFFSGYKATKFEISKAKNKEVKQEAMQSEQ